MNISKDKVVTMHYSVMDKEENVIDSSHDHEPLAFIQGQQFLIPGLENALEGHKAGDTFSVNVDAKEAYGERHDGFVQTVDKNMFGENEIEVGMQFRATTDDGEQTVIVVDVQDDKITVDGNHPLAGVDLVFDVEIIDVRDATAEELQHGHVHGEGGCGHHH
ncbi:FKBP-type peptidyl-prolyl cis-trans isomerase [Flocculibacter collagenilyticus]|uniref:FKBP-type peptidyl-prolyl cis-trans isomerase n=1 Tax=Flocculibacter collagenilyticus TaxID=2744479 RepID=UPI0018F792BD|nr:peptidylprolyl isomerase [Flocculibacter collagenilyticus]